MLGIEGIDYKAVTQAYLNQVDEADLAYDRDYQLAWNAWYRDSKDSADKYNRAREEIDRKYPGWTRSSQVIPEAEQEFRCIRNAYIVEVAPILSIRDEAIKEIDKRTRQALASACDTLLARVAADPFATWLVRDVLREKPREVPTVLSILPASLPEIDALAWAHSWCGSYVRLRRTAINLGLVPKRDLMEVGL